MFNDFFAGLFNSVSDASCMDKDNSDCMEGMTAAASQVSPMFIYVAVGLTILFLILAAVPKYSFKLGFFTDILIRRIIFLVGLVFSTLTLLGAYGASKMLCSMRTDSDIAWDNFSPLININFYISLVIYPVLFWAVAFCFNRFLNRRKLNTVFVSNNKIFGII
jgi:hypothetical protein